MAETAPRLGALGIVWRSLGLLLLSGAVILFGLAWYFDWFPPDSPRRGFLGLFVAFLIALSFGGLALSVWARQLTAPERWPAVVALLIVAGTWFLSPRFAAVRGPFWPEPLMRNLAITGALGLALAVVAWRRKFNWVAVAGVGASCWAMLPALLRVVRVWAGGW